MSDTHIQRAKFCAKLFINFCARIFKFILKKGFRFSVNRSLRGNQDAIKINSNICALMRIFGNLMHPVCGGRPSAHASLANNPASLSIPKIDYWRLIFFHSIYCLFLEKPDFY